MRLFTLLRRRARAFYLLVLANLAFLLLLYKGLYAPQPNQISTGPHPPDIQIINDLQGPHRPINAEDLSKAKLYNPEDEFQPAKLGVTKFVSVKVDTTDLGPCDNVQAPAYPVTETFKFYRVEPDKDETFVFSAYFDPRTKPAAVRILGMGSGADTPSKFCQLWYRGAKQPKILPAQYHIVPETHDMR